MMQAAQSVLPRQLIADAAPPRAAQRWLAVSCLGHIGREEVSNGA